MQAEQHGREKRDVDIEVEQQQQRTGVNNTHHVRVLADKMMSPPASNLAALKGAACSYRSILRNDAAIGPPIVAMIYWT
jgi:hypothetical protein